MRKWYCSIVVKILALAVAMVGISYCVRAAEQFYTLNKSYQTVEEGDPLEYNGFTAFHTFIDYYEVYRSEEYIKTGALVNEEALETMRIRFAERLATEYDELEKEYENKYSEVEDEEVLVLLQNEYLIEKQKLDAQVEQQVENYRNSLIRSQLTEYSHIKDQYNDLNTKYDFFMYVSNGSIKTNIEEGIDSRDSASVIDHFSNLPMYDTYNIAYSEPYIFGYFVEEIPDTVSEVHIGIDKEYYESYVAKMEEQNFTLTSEEKEDLLRKVLLDLATGGVMYVVAALFLMIVSGRETTDDEIHFTVFDSIYMDLYTIITVCIVICSIPLAIEFFRFVVYNLTSTEFSSIVSIVAYLLGIYGICYLTTLSKRIKTHTLFKHTLIYAVCNKIFTSIHNQIMKATNTNEALEKQSHSILAIIAGIMLVGIVLVPGFFGILWEEEEILVTVICQSCVCVVVWIILQRFMMKYVADLLEIKKGTELIRKGNLSYSIPLLKNNGLNVIADNINSISDGLKHSVEDAVTSEKTKVELVANVSHDLKTPLTSIVNYIDLLSRENVTVEESKYYIEILQLKSHQLKKLVEDLFELTNIQNGQIEAELSEI
ncbi:MAG: hypothetical protein IKL88_02180, partial [Erysipelotrichales bacterium]|nr:hypothetical protein [Erysipelotrichales bacterium]